MPPSNVCWGIEMGAGAIKAIKLESDGGRVRVADFAIVPHAKVLSTPELDQDDAMRVALGTLVAQKDLSGAAIAISMPGHQSFARFAKLPPVEPKKVPDIVKFEAVQQIPFPLEDVEWDYQTFVSPDSPDVEVGIFAITRPRIMERLQLLGDVGITPDVATISPVAAYNALAYDLQFTEDTPGTIILDIGTSASDLIIADAGRVWVRTFPIGGHQFTDALVSAFKLSYSKAERLKKEAEQTKHKRHVFQAMRPVFTDLVQEIQRSIGYYQSVHEGADLKRLIGLGSTFHLPGLRKYLKQQLQLDVYRMEAFKRVEVDGAREGEMQDAMLNMATASGLALQYLGMGALNANLMPVSVVREAMWRRKRVWFGVAAGVSAAATAAMFLRPLLDQTAFTGAERPDSINRLVRVSGDLKGDAETAGITESGVKDFTASKLLGLMDGQDLMPHVSEDLGQLVADAQSAAEPDLELGQRAIWVNALSTTYYKKASAQSASSRRGGRADDPQAQAENKNAVNPEEFDRILVTAELMTDHPDPQQFQIDFLEGWFEKHAEREGVPYTLYADPQTWQVELLDPRLSNDPTGDPARNALRRTGRRANPVGRMPNNLTMPGQQPGGAYPVPGGRDPYGTRGNVGATDDPSEEELIRKLDTLAPIETPEEGQPSPTARVVMTWQLLLGPAQEDQS